MSLHRDPFSLRSAITATVVPNLGPLKMRHVDQRHQSRSNSDNRCSKWLRTTLTLKNEKINASNNSKLSGGVIKSNVSERSKSRTVEIWRLTMRPFHKRGCQSRSRKLVDLPVAQGHPTIDTTHHVLHRQLLVQHKAKHPNLSGHKGKLHLRQLQATKVDLQLIPNQALHAIKMVPPVHQQEVTKANALRILDTKMDPAHNYHVLLGTAIRIHLLLVCLLRLTRSSL